MRIQFTRWPRYGKAIVLGAAAALIAVSCASAQERPRLKNTPERGTRAPIVADAPNARMAALIRAPDGFAVMKKGVQNINRIDTGVYCIKPEAATGIDPMTAVVVVSVEYFYSLFNEVMVQWARKGAGCPADRIGVYTLADENLNARYSFSNSVGFLVYVP